MTEPSDPVVTPDPPDRPGSPAAPSAGAPLRHLSDALAALVAMAAPRVVSVESHRSRCSGFIWRAGLVATADEALAEEGEVVVRLSDGRAVPATVVGRDPATDVALLRIEPAGEAPPRLEPARAPARVGALAVAVGAQAGGVVAALGSVAVSGPAWRSLRGGEIDARLELDLTLRRQAEGGLALDADGGVLGMVVFAPRRQVLVIPWATLERVAARLLAHGRVARGYLGLGLQPVRLDAGMRAGVGADRAAGIGAMVMSVDSTGPGAAAGVRQGDVIVAWDGRPVDAIGALLRALGPDSVGRVVALSLLRAGEAMRLDLTIGERPQP